MIKEIANGIIEVLTDKEFWFGAFASSAFGLRYGSLLF